MKNRYIYLLILALSFAFSSQAQLGEYQLNKSTVPYVALTTTAIPLDTIGATPGYVRKAYHVALPFDFTLGNITSDSLWIDLSGFCALSRNSVPPLNFSTYGLALSATPYYDGIMAPQSGSFSVNVANTTNAGIYTDVSGTAPNRIFTVEWRNLRGTNRHVQMMLHETSGILDFNYSCPGSTTSNYEVGLRLSDTSIFTGQALARTNLYLVPSSSRYRSTFNWDTTFASKYTTERLFGYLNTYNTIPLNMRYSWTPPSPCTGATTAGTLPDTLNLCSGQFANLAPTGLSSGLSYQWQVSANGTTWGNVTDGQGAQNFQYNTARLRSTTPVWYRLQATCAANAQVLYSSTTVIKTTHLLPPYTENFESITQSGDIPGCMFIATPPLGSNYGWSTSNDPTYAYSGNKVLKNTGNNGDSSTWVHSPGVYLQTGKQYRFSFMYIVNAQSYASDSMRISIGTLPEPQSINNVATTTLSPVPSDPNYFTFYPVQHRYRRMTVNFTVPSSGVYFGGIKKSTSTLNSLGGYIDNMEIMEVPDTDVLVDSVLNPSLYATTCYEPLMNVKIRVANAGTQSISNIPVYYKVNNTTYGPETITQSIAPGSSIQYTFTQQASMPGLSTAYNIRAWAALPGDTYRSNDTSYMMPLTSDTLKPVPYRQTFESSATSATNLSSVKWYGNFAVSNITSTSGSSRIMRINLGSLPANGKDSVATVPIGPVATNSFLRFKYRMAKQNGTSATMLPGDTVYVTGSINCGQLTDTLLKIHAGFQTTGTDFVYAPTTTLNQLAGGKMRISFISVKTSNVSNFYFDVDSFQVLNMTPADVSLTGIRKIPSLACDGDNIAIRIAVKNNGALDATGFPVKVSIDGQPPALNYTYPGTLSYNQSDTIDIGTLPVSGTGLHHLKIYTQQPLDTTSSNDTLYRDIIVTDPPAMHAALDTSACGAVTLSFTHPDSTIALWYNSDQPGASLFMAGNDPVTVDYSDTFYVRNKKYMMTGGGPATYNPNWNGLTSLTGYGLAFDALSDIILDSVGVYPSGTGSITVEMVTCANCPTPQVIASKTYNFSNATGTDKYMLPLQQYLPAGSNYGIRLQAVNGLNGLVRDFPFTGFPLAPVAAPVNITNSFTPFNYSLDYYYYFYDWKIKALSSCDAGNAVVSVAVKNRPEANFNAAVNGNNVTFNNTSQGGGTSFWNFGDSQTSSLTTTTHTYDAPGTYTVKLVQTNECGSDSLVKNVVVQVSAIASVHPDWNNITAYPNPASQKINLAFHALKADNAMIRIMDATGRECHKEAYAIKQGDNTISQKLDALSAGTYWIILHTDGNKAQVKFTVIR